MARIIIHTLLGLLIATLVLPFAGSARRAQLIQWWCKQLLAAFNLQVRTHGHVPNNTTQPHATHFHATQPRATLFIANHISWSDIHAINSVVRVRFIAKAEIRQWPIFGYLVSRANTLFIDRSRKRDAKRTLDAAVQSLQAGDNLCLFPEGTTSDGSTVLPFKSSLIEAAILAKASIWPVAIRYPHPDGGINTEAAYAGDTTLVASMQKLLRQRQPVIELHFLAPMTADATTPHDRRALARHMETLIRQQLEL